MQLADLPVNFEDVTSRQQSMPDQVAGISRDDLVGLTNELYDHLDALAAGLTDAQVTFVAEDPAQDEEPGWNLAHVILHITASAEEGMALGSSLARNVEFTGRSRYEPDWETITTSAQITQRLAESHRMALAFLETWPDEPYLDNVYEHDYFGPMNAMSHAVLGLFHGQHMLPQVAEIVRQAKAAS
ncbi:MAG: DinB family protein [Chloroflexota bacterium]|nr:DinB family protein [Chloroflexota bacterium]